VHVDNIIVGAVGRGRGHFCAVMESAREARCASAVGRSAASGYSTFVIQNYRLKSTCDREKSASVTLIRNKTVR
jgi:hypothetical protein